MADHKKRVPITELPIRVYREIGGDGKHLAFMDGGNFHFVFLADGAIEAKRKAKDWASAEQAKMDKRKPQKEGAE